MGFRIIAAMAAVFLISACETDTQDTGAASGAGATTTATTTQSTTQAAPQPAGPTPGSQEDLVVNVGDRVFFDFDKHDVTSDAQSTLERQAAWLKTNPAVTITIEGHCDERGTREYNLALGERRANSVKDYLVALGIDPGRVKTLSYGKERPVALGSNDAAWAQNRRGVSVVTGAGS